MLHDRAEKKLFVYANMELDKQASAFDPVYGKPGGSSDFEILKQMDIPQRGSRSTCQSIDMCSVFVPWCRDGHYSRCMSLTATSDSFQWSLFTMLTPVSTKASAIQSELR